jgi:aminocarboxymuconate-semialdehyde decarboxylase
VITDGTVTPCIDVHSHFFPREVLDALRTEGGRYRTPLRIEADGTIFVVTPERPYGPIGLGFYDVDHRLKFMRAEGITTQVLCAPPFLFYYWLDARAALDIIRMENDAIAVAVGKEPERFIGLGTVPLQDVGLAVRECERIAGRSLRGVEIGSNVDGRDLDAPEFWPFFEAAEALGLAILIHGGNVAAGDRMDDYHLRNLVGFPVDTTLAAARLIFSGVLDRFPDLRICIAQAGGFLPYVTGRLDHGYAVRPECRRFIAQAPSEYLRHRLYFDTITHSPRVLRLLLDTVGAARVMLGSDFPFDMGAPHPRSAVTAQSDLSPAALRQIYSDTAREFLGLG